MAPDPRDPLDPWDPRDPRDPGKSAGSTDEFQKSQICCYLSYLRACGLSKIDSDPSLAPVRPRMGSRRAEVRSGRPLAEQPGRHGKGAKHKK